MDDRSRLRSIVSFRVAISLAIVLACTACLIASRFAMMTYASPFELQVVDPPVAEPPDTALPQLSPLGEVSELPRLDLSPTPLPDPARLQNDPLFQAIERQAMEAIPLSLDRSAALLAGSEPTERPWEAAELMLRSARLLESDAARFRKHGQLELAGRCEESVKLLRNQVVILLSK